MKNSEPPEVRTPNSGCDTENPPPGYEIVKNDHDYGKTRWQQCQEYWIKTREIPGTLAFSKEFERQSAIRIIEKRYPMDRSQRDPRKRQKLCKHSFTNCETCEQKYNCVQSETICYNPNFLQQRGWCEIRGSTEKERRWGVCSTSCDLYYRYSGTSIKPPVYHELHLRFSGADRDSSIHTNTRSFLNNALALSKPLYPEQKIWTFESSVPIKGRQALEGTFKSIGGNNEDVSKGTKVKLFGNESSMCTKSKLFSYILKRLLKYKLL